MSTITRKYPTRSIRRLLVAPLVLMALAACGDGEGPTVPETSSRTGTADPSYAKGGGGGAKVTTFGARAYGHVKAEPNGAPTLLRGQGVLNVTRPYAGLYCLELPAASFPDPNDVTILVSGVDGNGVIHGVLKPGQNWCPQGNVGVATFDFSNQYVSYISFTFIIM